MPLSSPHLALNCFLLFLQLICSQRIHPVRSNEASLKFLLLLSVSQRIFKNLLATGTNNGHKFARLLREYGRGKRALALESEDLSLSITNDITCVTLGNQLTSLELSIIICEVREL